MIILTSNLATDNIMELYAGDEKPGMGDVVDEIRPVLSAHFLPALLARMSIVPYGPIKPDAMKLITRLKLGKLTRLIEESHGFTPSFSEEMVEEIAKRCTAAETGARNVDHIMRGSLMPLIAKELLVAISGGEIPVALEASLAPDGNFRVDIDVEEAE